MKTWEWIANSAVEAFIFSLGVKMRRSFDERLSLVRNALKELTEVVQMARGAASYFSEKDAREAELLIRRLQEAVIRAHRLRERRRYSDAIDALQETLAETASSPLITPALRAKIIRF